jgi:hypothetical protein
MAHEERREKGEKRFTTGYDVSPLSRHFLFFSLDSPHVEDNRGDGLEEREVGSVCDVGL